MAKNTAHTDLRKFVLNIRYQSTSHVVNRKNREIFSKMDARGGFYTTKVLKDYFYDFIFFQIIIKHVIHLNDSDFLSLFFELFVVYKAIIVIICRRKYELLM